MREKKHAEKKLLCLVLLQTRLFFITAWMIFQKRHARTLPRDSSFKRESITQSPMAPEKDVN